MSGMSYDTSGNLTSQMRSSVAEMMNYDSENRMTSHVRGSVTTSYIYDGDGRRVKKSVGTAVTLYVYNAGGRLVAEYTNPEAPIEGEGGTSYLTSDHLGSTRIVTNATGAVKRRLDILPDGQELGSGIGARTLAMGYSQPDGLKQKFTGKERDVESGMDYFLARYYSAAQGRFTSPDLPFADQSEVDPQSWNLYPYVRNNPLSYTDPFGFWREIASGVWEWEENDTWESLAQRLNVDVSKLKEAFQGAELKAGFIAEPGDLSILRVNVGADDCWCLGEKFLNYTKYELWESNEWRDKLVAEMRQWLKDNYSGPEDKRPDHDRWSNYQVIYTYRRATSPAGPAFDSFLGGKKSKKSGKERATDIPSWAQGQKPLANESGNNFAKRLLDEKYGTDNYPKGPGSEFSKLKKYGDRNQ